MCEILRVRWTITPQTAPQPWVPCSSCGCLRPFKPSGKARLNANGRKLDAWLIYKCLFCDKSWNRPVFERKNVQDIDPAMLAALQTNDPHWTNREAFNLHALRRKSQRIDEFSGYEIIKETVQDAAQQARFEIEMTVIIPVAIRLDRLIAGELQISRSKLQTLHKCGRLRLLSGSADMLRKPVKSSTLVALDLSEGTCQPAISPLHTRSE